MYSEVLKNFFLKFEINVEVINILKGSVIETYELKLLSSTLISKILNLQSNLSLELGFQVRIIAPLPNKRTIGIEIPLINRKIIKFETLISNLNSSKFKLPIILGEDVYGNIKIEDLTTFPHLLIAGSTGSGKSNFINSIICSILHSKKIGEVYLVLIDPKRVELNQYEGLRYLWKHRPIATDSCMALQYLNDVISEMNDRYKELSEINLKEVNDKFYKIVIVIDELADLMLTPENKQIEKAIQKIAQLGRAAGIHLIVATQRPTTNILTGKIKTNLTVRISFKVTQEIDSRTILNFSGAEKLLGYGDMLFQKNGIERFHGAFVSDTVVIEIINNIKKNPDHLKYFFNWGDYINIDYLINKFKLTYIEANNCMLKLKKLIDKYNKIYIQKG